MATQTNRQALEADYQDLLAELDEIEREQHDTTLSHSEQQMLDQAWDDCMRRIELTEELLARAEEEALNQEDDDRPDCSRCAGCAYCEESAPGYDGADEV